MIVPKIAYRNIIRHRRRSFFTGLTIAGGFFLYSLMAGLQFGSYNYLIEMFTRDRIGHVQVHRKGYLDKASLYSAFGDYEAMGSRIAGLSGVRSWSPRIYAPALAFKGRKTTGVKVIGIDPPRERNTTQLLNKVVQGRFVGDAPGRELVMGEGLALLLNARIGDEVALITQGADGSIANGLFTIVGFAEKNDRTNCYIHLAAAQEFLSLGGRAHELVVVVSGQDRARRDAARIAKLLDDPRLDVEPWQVVERTFYETMRADVKGNYITYFVFMFIVAIGVLNTVLMMILERTREFGVLRAVGTRPAMLFSLIVAETSMLAILSLLPALALSIAVNGWLSSHGIPFPPVQIRGMVFDRMLSEVSVRSTLVPFVITLASAIVVSVAPALRAARIVPVKALRER